VRGPSADGPRTSCSSSLPPRLSPATPRGSRDARIDRLDRPRAAWRPLSGRADAIEAVRLDHRGEHDRVPRQPRRARGPSNARQSVDRVRRRGPRDNKKAVEVATPPSILRYALTQNSGSA
jgi:hypothetical protein